MKVYHGDRTMEGVVVTVDGRPLNPRLDIKAHSRNGFEWGYEGPEPAQLALAILVEHWEDEDKALQNCDIFMREAVANFANEWSMTTADIDRLIERVS